MMHITGNDIPVQGEYEPLPSETCPWWADGKHCFWIAEGCSSPGPKFYKVCPCGATVYPKPELLEKPDGAGRYRMRRWP